jgi:hypothetical protein
MDDDPDVVPAPPKRGRKPAKMADDDAAMDDEPAAPKVPRGRAGGNADGLTIDPEQEPGMVPPRVDKPKKGQPKPAKKAPKTPVKRKKKPARQPDGSDMDFNG